MSGELARGVQVVWVFVRVHTHVHGLCFCNGSFYMVHTYIQWYAITWAQAFCHLWLCSITYHASKVKRLKRTEHFSVSEWVWWKTSLGFLLWGWVKSSANWWKMNGKPHKPGAYGTLCSILLIISTGLEEIQYIYVKLGINESSAVTRQTFSLCYKFSGHLWDENNINMSR